MVSTILGLLLIIGGLILFGMEYSLSVNSKKPIQNDHTLDQNAFEIYKKSIEAYKNRTPFQHFYKIAVGMIFIFCGIAVILELFSSNAILMILFLSIFIDRYFVNKTEDETKKK